MSLISEEKISDFLKRSYKETCEYLTDIRFNKKSDCDRNRVLLYSRLIELAYGMVILLDKKAYAGVEPIFRTFFEAYVDLRILFSDPNYKDHLEYEYHEQWEKLLTIAKKGQNPFLSKIGAHKDVQKRISDHQHVLKKLTQRGITKSLKKKDKFDRANLSAEYESIYNFLCSESHNDLRCLYNRHIDGDSSDFKIVLFREDSWENILPTVSTVTEILLEVSERIHSEFKSSKLAEIQKLKAEFAKIRSEYATLS